jgi:hypothetical protein
MIARKFLVLLGVFAVAACDCEGETEGLGDGSIGYADAVTDPSDTGIQNTVLLDMGAHDLGGDLPDVDQPDLGVADTGARDAAPTDRGRDAGSGCGVLAANPTPLSFAASPSQELLTVVNSGACDVFIQDTRISGPQDDPDHPSADDFSVVAMSGSLIPAGASITITVRFENNDFSALDFAELHLQTDAEQTEATFVLSGRSEPCLLPTANIQVLTAMPAAGQPVTLSAATSNPGPPNATIVFYEWSFFFAPGANPVFSDPNGVETTFIPLHSGTYVVGLSVRNSCGSVSGAATETINVP